MLFEHLPTAAMLSERALAAACEMMQVPDATQIKLYATRTNQVMARQLQGRFGFEVVLIPDAMMNDKWAWAVEWDGRLVGSKGRL